MNKQPRFRYRHLYKTARWKALRDAQLKREPYCRMCRQMKRLTPATIVDHIEPHRGDEEKFFNGAKQSLCDTHHNAVKQSQERRGVMRGADTSGVPLDPKHPWNAN